MSSSVLFRVRFTPMDSHVRARIYVGKPNTTLALAGTLVVRVEEWDAFRKGNASYELVRDEEADGGE